MKLKDEYIFDVNMELSDEVFDTELEVNSYTFKPDMSDPVINTAITEHSELEGRDKPNQHPIDSITGLQQTLSDFAEIVKAKASIRLGTKEYWNNNPLIVPEKGELIVYTDYSSKIVDGQTVYIPRMKIGDGSVVVVDLPYVGDDIELMIQAHILDNDLHLRHGERQFWNNKVTTLLDTIDNENLIFTTKPINVIYNS